jgi:hypothetical protein
VPWCASLFHWEALQQHSHSFPRLRCLQSNLGTTPLDGELQGGCTLQKSPPFPPQSPPASPIPRAGRAGRPLNKFMDCYFREAPHAASAPTAPPLPPLARLPPLVSSALFWPLFARRGGTPNLWPLHCWTEMGRVLQYRKMKSRILGPCLALGGLCLSIFHACAVLYRIVL